MLLNDTIQNTGGTYYNYHHLMDNEWLFYHTEFVECEYIQTLLPYNM